MKLNWKTALASLVLVIQASAVAQAAPPSHEVPNGVGLINDVQGQMIVVGDEPFLLQGFVLVTNRAGDTLTTRALQPNRRVEVFSESNPVPGLPPLARRIIVTGH